MKNIIVFGANSDLAKPCISIWAKKGYNLHLVSSSPDSLEFEVSSKIALRDLSEESIRGVFLKLDEDNVTIDFIVSFVGSIVLKPAHLTSEKDFLDAINTNLVSSFLILKESSKRMLVNKSGSILFFSSVAAKIGLANHEAISAAKGGLEAMIRSAAATYAKSNIRINCVAPGLVKTKLSSKLTSNPKALEISERMHPLGRVGEVHDFSKAIDWLLTEASWVSGQSLSIDGGMSTIK